MKTPRRRSGSKRRATMVYLDPEVHRASKMRAAARGWSLSDQVNEALRSKLSRDQSALELIRKRKHEPTISYEEVLRDMKRRGLL